MTLRLSKLIISSLIMAVAATSCRDEVDLPDNGAWGSAGADGVATLSYHVDGEMPEGRSIAASPHECRLNHAYVLFFDAATGSRTFKAYRRMETDGLGKVKFDIPTSLEEGKEYLTLVIGNADLYNPRTDVYASFGDYIEAIATDKTPEQVRLILSAGSADPIIKGSPAYLPMWGRLIDGSGRDINFSFRKTETGYIIEGEFFFSRALSRLDLLNLVPGTLDIRYVKVCNYQPRGLFFEDWTPAGYNPVVLENATDAPSGDGSDGYVAMPEGDAVQELTASLYALCNTVSASVINDHKTTCLIIAGYYTDPDTGVTDDQLTYYRLNMANPGESQLLKRNNVYRAVIKGVLHRGSPNDREAYERDLPVFDTSVDSDWETGGDNTSTDKDGNFLIVSRTQLTFQSGKISAAELHVFTSPGVTWTVEPVTDQEYNDTDHFEWSRIDDTSLKIGPVSTNDGLQPIYGYYNVVGTTPTGNTLSVRLNLQHLPKGEAIALSVDGRRGTIEVLGPRDGGTLSYIVRTESESASWRAVIVDADAAQWPNLATDVSFTAGGSDFGELRIKLAPYLTPDASATRVLTLNVEYAGNDQLEPSQRLAPVTLRITQQAATKWVTIDNYRENNTIDIDAFTTSSDYPNGLGAIVALNVRLADPTMKYMASSDFDPERDLFIDKAQQPRTTFYNNDPVTNGRPRKITGLEMSQPVYMHVFRTGPGDPEFTGQITVTVYRADENPEDVVVNAHNTVSVNVRVKAPECELDDVILWADETMQNGVSASVMCPEGYYVVSDRYVGHPSKVSEPAAPYYSPDQTMMTGGIRQDGSDDNDPQRALRSKFINRHINLDNGNADDISNRWISDQTCTTAEKDGDLYFYHPQRIGSWVTRLSQDAQKPCRANAFGLVLKHYVRYSKGRAFLVSSFNSARSYGYLVPVCCWIQGLGTPNSNTAILLSTVSMSGAGVSVLPMSNRILSLPMINTNGIYSDMNYINASRPYRPATHDEVLQYVGSILKNLTQQVK